MAQPNSPRPVVDPATAANVERGIAEVFGRMRVDDRDRFAQQKAHLRSTMITTFTANLPMTDWTPQDDIMMDQLTLWLVNVFHRSGRDDVVTDSVRAATANPPVQTPASKPAPAGQ